VLRPVAASGGDVRSRAGGAGSAAGGGVGRGSGAAGGGAVCGASRGGWRCGEAPRAGAASDGVPVSLPDAVGRGARCGLRGATARWARS
jgi:hypothetical protein